MRLKKEKKFLTKKNMYRIYQASVVTNENIASLKYQIKYKPQ